MAPVCSPWFASEDWLQWWPPPPLPRLQMTHMSAFAKVDGGAYQENRSERSLRIGGDVTGASNHGRCAGPSNRLSAQTLPAALFSTGSCTSHQPLLENLLGFSLLLIFPQSESNCILQQLIQHCSLTMTKFSLNSFHSY